MRASSALPIVEASSNCTFMELKYNGPMANQGDAAFKLYLYGIEMGVLGVV